MHPLPLIEPKQSLLVDDKFHQLNLFNVRNVIYWNIFFDFIKNIDGDIVECGIGRSRSLLIISALNYLYEKSEGGGRVIYGYDSFEGFPEPSSEDDSYRKPSKGDWAISPSGKYQYSIEFSKEVLKNGGVDSFKNEINLTKGFFNETLPNHPNRPIALLHVDGDLYSSYIETLTHLFPKVSKGGIIVFDDFYDLELGDDRWPGARTAVKEFLGGEFVNLCKSIRGSYYYIKK